MSDKATSKPRAASARVERAALASASTARSARRRSSSAGVQRWIASCAISSSSGSRTSSNSRRRATSIVSLRSSMAPSTSKDASISGCTIAPSPWRTTSSPWASSSLSAARTEVRFTLKRSASSRSGGSLLPAASCPPRMASRSCPATSSGIRRRGGGRKRERAGAAIRMGDLFNGSTNFKRKIAAGAAGMAIAQIPFNRVNPRGNPRGHEAVWRRNVTNGRCATQGSTGVTHRVLPTLAAMALLAGCTQVRSRPDLPDAATPPPQVEAYRIKAGDSLGIRFYKTPELNLDAPVRSDGKISVPPIGDVQAAGIPPAELAEALGKEFARELTNPRVTVVVLKPGGFVYVTGLVKNPVGTPYADGLTAMQAIAMAGGFDDRAALN